MLRNKPKLKYCGITVIMSNPSRFDTVSLLSATGGHLFNDICLRPDFNSMQCDVRLISEPSPLLPDTKVVILLGETAMHKWLPETALNSIGEIRGSVYKKDNIYCVPTFSPQDACDYKNLEARLNPLSSDYSPDGDDENEDEAEDYEATKSHGKTKRGNYAFWIKADVSKAKQIVQCGGSLPARPNEVQANYRIYPPADEVIAVLTGTKGGTLFFDIETDYEEQNLQCFAFSFDGITVYSVPILDYTYHLAYGGYHRILRALAIAIRDNLLVAHNGATFDFFVLAHKYHIPVNQCFDTLIAMHRCFPDIEKSLGHCVSYWTWQHFHKDEDSKGYMSKDQMMARLKYCGKDVYTLALIYKAIIAHAKRTVGLTDSIFAAMAAIRPYLITSIQGIKCDPQKIMIAARENDALMEQYDRMIKLLIGEKGLLDIRKALSGKPKRFAGSNVQCCVYFHELLGYPVVARSVKTGKPSLGKKAMFKLALKHENPVIQLVLAYRTIAKEFSTYKFIPWRTDDNKLGSMTVIEMYGNKDSSEPNDPDQTTLSL